MKKFLLVSIILIIHYSLFIIQLRAQQLPQYSQYLINDYVLNPAIGGSKGSFEAKSNHRYQWVGIVDAPRTYILSVNGPLKSEKVGVGGYLFTDRTGPTSRSGFYLSYAYHFKLNENVKLSTGLFGGLIQYSVDGSKITLNDKADPLSGGVESVVVPDASFGLYSYSDKFFLGVSAPQFFQNRLKLFGDTSQDRLKSHLFFTGGYKFILSDALEIEPSFLMKVMSPVPVQFDLSTKVIYQKKFWLGLSYRTYDAMSVMLGYSHLEQLFFGYSYDFTTSEIKNYSSGTHEIMIGIKFSKHQKKPESEEIDDALIE